MEMAGEISNLEFQPAFLLRGVLGIAICTYTPDFRYTLEKPIYNLPVKTKVVEEFKGSKDMWAYKRADYLIFRKWLQIDNPDITFIENVNGSISKPKFRLPSEKTA